MSRLSTAIAYVIPQSEQQPHIFPPGARCLDCEYKTETPNPNFVICKFLGKVNGDWGCPLYAQARDSAI